MEILSYTVWRLYHGKLSGPFCFSLYVFALWTSWVLCRQFIEPRLGQIEKKVGRLSSWVLMLLPFLFFFWAAYPGVYVIDSMIQLKQTMTQSYGDWHPPLMSWIWGALIKLTNLHESFFWFHSLLVFASLLIWSYILFKLTQTPAWIVFLISVISPVFLLYSGVVIKDTGTAFGLLAACGLAILPKLGKSNKSVAYSFAILLLFYAASIRQNALPAALPVLFLIFKDLTVGPLKYVKVSILVGVVTACIVLFGNFLKYEFLNSKREFIQQTLFFHDISFISINTGSASTIPVEFQTERYSLSALRDSWVLGTSATLFLPYDNPQHPLQLSNAAEANSKLKERWLQLVSQNPVLYLKHRLLVFNWFLNLSGSYYDKWGVPIEIARDNNLTLPKTLPGARYIEHILSRSVGFLASWTPLVSVWFWVVACSILSIISFLRINQGILPKCSFPIAFSGLLYLAPYFFILPHCEYRYIYWSSIAGIFSFCLLFTKPNPAKANSD
jgi:hypothetical protein